MLCPKCGTENPDGSIMCNGCGYIIDTSGPLSDMEEHVSEASDGRVKYVFKKRKEQGEQTPTFADLKPRIDNAEKKDTGVSVGVNKSRFFSSDSHSSSPIDIREALAREERNEMVKQTEYSNRFIQEMPEEEVPKPEQVIEGPSDIKANYVIIGLLAVAVLITMLISTKLKNMEIYKAAVEGFTNLVGDSIVVNALPFLLYVLLIFLLSYDSFKTKDFSMKKNVRKNVLAALGVAIISIIVFDGFSAFSIGDTYFNLMIRFLIILAILSANTYFKKSYFKIENKLGIRNILFEFLIYYNIFTIVLYLFF